MGCDCGQQVRDQVSKNVLWLEGKYLYLTSSQTAYLAPDQWLDCSDYLDAWVQLEFTGTNGNLLTVSLETSPALSTDDSAWTQVTSASSTLTNGAALLVATESLATPPMGYLRLKFTAGAGTVQGVLRVVICFKQES